MFGRCIHLVKSSCAHNDIKTVRATKQQTQHTSILRDKPQRAAPTTSTTPTAQQPLRQREQKQGQPEAQQEHRQEQDWQIAASRGAAFSHVRAMDGSWRKARHRPWVK